MYAERKYQKNGKCDPLKLLQNVTEFSIYSYYNAF